MAFFTATDATHGKELWRTDGTADGTVLVKDVYPGTDSAGNPHGSSPANLTSVGGALYFTAVDGVNANRLWKSDGTPDGTVVVQTIGPSGDRPTNFISFNGAL